MKKLLLFAFLILFCFSCKKYPEGPLISLKSKDSRICRTWRVERYTINGVDRTNATLPLWTEHTIIFNKNGEVEYRNHPKYHNSTGSWSFESEKQNLSITLDSLNEYSVIDRLTSDELWLEKHDGPNLVETHFRAE